MIFFISSPVAKVAAWYITIEYVSKLCVYNNCTMAFNMANPINIDSLIKIPFNSPGKQNRTFFYAVKKINNYIFL